MKNSSCDLCDQTRQLEAGIVASLGEIAMNGWRIATGDAPPLAYTVGSWKTHRKPELVVCGIDQDLSIALLDNLGAMLCIGGKVMASSSVVIRPLHDTWKPDLVPLILEHYRESTIPVQQVLWADDVGTFPWEDGFDPSHHDQQPLAWLPKAEHPASVWLG